MPLYSKATGRQATRDHTSALSWRPGVSVPGATKHIPGSAAVPPRVKTAVNTRDDGQQGATANKDLVERALGAEAQKTTYAQNYVPDPRHDYTVDPRQGTRAAAAQLPAALVDPKPFLGQSTYQAEIAGRAVASVREGGPATAPPRSPQAPASPPAATRAATSPQQAPSVKPGYLTQSVAATLPLQHKLTLQHSGAGDVSGVPAASAHAQRAAAPREHHQGSLANACHIMSRFERATTYGSMYAVTESGGALATEQLNKGTAKTSLHVPGYGGHVPSEAALVQAGLGARARKEEALLYQLDQHSWGLVPGYTGHKPQHKPAVSLEAPPPTTATTQGLAHQQALRWGGAAPPAAALNSRSGVLSFFSSGSGGGAFVSENGLAEAAMYHQRARPFEGLMKIPHASATNRQGGKFTA